MKVTLAPISINSKTKLEAYLKEYLQEITPGSDGKYKYLHEYWNKPNHFPYWIKVNDQVAGFVLINDYTVGPNNVLSISEFYIGPKYRGKDVGSKAVELALALKPGKWEIRVLKDNVSAQQFWEKVLSKHVNDLKRLDMNTEKWQGKIYVLEV